MEKRNKTLGVSALQQTPGPLLQAASKEYFARGSLQSIQIGHWKIFASMQLVALMMMSAAMWQLIPLKTVEIVTVERVEGGGGRVVSEAAKTGWKPTEANISYQLNNWAESVFDINYSTWKRNVDRSAEMVSGTALEQLRELLRKEDFNPAALIANKSSFVRTYEFISLNFIKDDVALLRFKTTSRGQANATPIIKTFALTANFSFQPPKTQQEAVKNPAGLFITSFNLSEEASEK
jgi:type IV secretion system protein TrbF